LNAIITSMTITDLYPHSYSLSIGSISLSIESIRLSYSHNHSFDSIYSYTHPNYATII